MKQRKVFTIEVEIEESRDETEAWARLRLGGESFDAEGHARRNPDDPDVPRIGEELAMARALKELVDELVERVDEGIEAFEGHEVHIKL